MCDLLYNKLDNLKDKYLNTITNEKTKKFVDYIFRESAAAMEFDLNKDVCQFNDLEVDKLLGSYVNKSQNSVAVKKSHLESYVNFCDKLGYVPTRINHFSVIKFEDLKKYVGKRVLNNKYVTLDELREYENELINYQDKAILRMCFIGLRGQYLSEIINLKIGNIKNEGNDYWIELEERGKVVIDEESYLLLLYSHSENEYMRKNGEVEGNARSFKNEVVSSDYIIRPMGKNRGNSPISFTSLQTRIAKILDYIGLDGLEITPTSIWRSGMFWKLWMIEKNENREINRDDIRKLHELYRYGMNYLQRTELEYAEYKNIKSLV